MSMNPHPRVQLSAYLDDALSAVERSAVAAHLDSCGDCRARLAELRATASLIRALPDLSPGRRLVPRISAVPAWLAPLRTLTTMASGVSAFLFIASALLANVGTLATSSSGAAQPAAIPAAGGAGTSSQRSESAATATPSEALGAIRPPATAADSKTATSPTPAASPAPAQQFSTSTNAPQDAPGRSVANDAQREGARAAAPLPQLGPSPWLWLVLAVALGASAIWMQRRLRSN
jgi:anti-sigma factor RsiW